MSLFGSYLEENFGVENSIPFSISESVDLSN